MNTTRYAYLCNVCDHCKLADELVSFIRLWCPMCMCHRKFRPSSKIVDHGECEEWTRI